MDKFEFVSYNEEDRDDALCFGRMVFKYNGRPCKTGTGFLCPHNTFEVCRVKTWTTQDIDWKSIHANISEDEKPLFVKLVVDHVIPLISNCDCCSKPHDGYIDGVNLSNKHIKVLD